MSRHPIARWFLPVLALLLSGGGLHAGENNGPHLEVHPATIRLRSGERRQQLLVSAFDGHGQVQDVTDQCTIAIDDPGIAVVGDGRVTGLLQGHTLLTVRWQSLECRVAVEVDDLTRPAPVDFQNDLVPLFAKLRCNGSGCHGKQSGQNGFKLSVFGFDPRADYDALVKEARGRRVFPAAPERSLLVRKAVGELPHGGGRRTEPNSDDAELMRRWIAQGTPWANPRAPELQTLQVLPGERVMGFQSVQRLLVTAVYSDGSKRDVTAAAAYTSNAPEVAQVDPQGRVRTGRTPGEAAITVRYLDQVAAARLIVPRPRQDDDPVIAVPGNQAIDQLVWNKLARLNLRPSETCDDATFLRRLYLDAIGTLPTADEVRAFLADPATDKRSRAIDRVLNRDEFADYWALKWSDVLMVNSESLGHRGSLELHLWLRRQVAENRPYDQWVRELLTASGDSGRDGPVNFHRALRTPEDLAKGISQAFLGIRLDCAQCHHHPFERWGQEDFYAMAGFFNGLQRKPLGAGRELVFHAGYRPSQIPLTQETIDARPLGSPPLKIADGDPRVPLAQWLTAADNPWFARLAANRLWKHYLGRGLVEPEDDLRSTNPATNPPLLDYLAQSLIDSNFDLKSLMREILNSQAYQLSSRANASNVRDEQNFSRHLVRRLPAEVLLDAISQATGSPEPFAGVPRGTRSIELWDNRLPSYFLDVFGRSPRESPCACGKSGEPTMAQALHLMNAPEIEAKIAAPQGRIAALIGAGTDRDRIVEQLCLATLGRPPNDRDRRAAAALFHQQPQQQAAEDFLWTLLNSYEFLFIH